MAIRSAVIAILLLIGMAQVSGISQEKTMKVKQLLNFLRAQRNRTNSDLQTIKQLDILAAEGEASTAAPRSTGLFTFVVEGICLISVSVLGCILNVLAIVLICKTFKRQMASAREQGNNTRRRHEKTEEIKRMLITLSLFDMIYLLMAIGIFGGPAVSQTFRTGLYLHILPYWYGVAHIGRVGSVLLTLCVTLERYYSVCHPVSPFLLKRYLLPLSVGFSILYNLPKFFELRLKVSEREVVIGQNEMTGENDTSVAKDLALVPTDLRMNWWYVTFYLFWSKFLLIELLPYVLMGGMNYRIWKRIKTLATVSRSARNGSGRRLSEDEEIHEDELQLARTLAMVVVVFIVCQSFKIIPDLYEVLVCPRNSDGEANEQCMSSPVIEAVIDLSHLMLAINSSVNFFIYVLNRGRFRESIVQLLSNGAPPIAQQSNSIHGNYEMVPLGLQNSKSNGISLDTKNVYQLTSPAGDVTERLSRMPARRKSELKMATTEEEKMMFESWQWPFSMYYMPASFDNQNGELTFICERDVSNEQNESRPLFPSRFGSSLKALYENSKGRNKEKSIGAAPDENKAIIIHENKLYQSSGGDGECLKPFHVKGNVHHHQANATKSSPSSGIFSLGSPQRVLLLQEKPEFFNNS